MKPDYIFWVALAAYALHILEEYNYDWKTWAQKILKLDVDWNTFYITNAIMLFVGIACAEIGWALSRKSDTAFGEQPFLRQSKGCAVLLSHLSVSSNVCCMRQRAQDGITQD